MFGPLGKIVRVLICRVGMVLSFVAWLYTHSPADVVDSFCSAKSSCRRCWAQYQESGQLCFSLNFRGSEVFRVALAIHGQLSFN